MKNKTKWLSGAASLVLSTFIACGSALAVDKRYMPLDFPEDNVVCTNIDQEPQIDFRWPQRVDLKGHPYDGTVPILITKEFAGPSGRQAMQLLAIFDYHTNTFEVNGTLPETNKENGKLRLWGTTVKGHIVGARLGSVDPTTPGARLVIDDIDMKSGDQKRFHPQNPGECEVAQFMTHVLSRETLAAVNLDAHTSAMKEGFSIPSSGRTAPQMRYGF